MSSVSVYEVKKRSKLKGVNWVAVWKEHRNGSSLRELEKKYNLNRGLLWLSIQAVESVAHSYTNIKKRIRRQRRRLRRLRRELRS